ncbi:MAG: hypothetical protein RIK87_26915 [Fuerstiella sp.]
MANVRPAIIRILLSTLCLLLAAAPAVAQRSRGSETDLLRRTEVHQELGLTEEQSTKLQDLQNQSTPTRETFEQYRKELEAASSDEEKAKIREDFSQKVIKSRTMFQDNALSVLNDTQRRQLRGLYLSNAGPRGLAGDELAADYGLTEDQKKKLEEVSDQQRAAARNLDSETSEEDRQKFNDEWQAKYLAVLTPEQKARFEQEVAQAPQRQDTVAERSEAPGNAAAPTSPGVVPPPMSTQPPAGESAVLSFGGATVPGERRLVQEFQFNFRYAPWDQVLQLFADGAGLTLDLNKVPPGTFSHLDDRKYSARQALDIMNGYLLRQGFGLFQKDGFLIVRNLDDGIPPSLLRDVTIEQLLQLDPLLVGSNELVNVTLEVQDMDTAKAAQEIEPLVGPWGSMIALTESHLLIITDIGANLRRIHGLLTQAMSKSRPDALMFKAYFLKHMDAEEAEIQVMTQFGMRQNVANVSYGVEQQSRAQSRAQSRNQTPTPAPPSNSSTEPDIQIASDLRLNSLLVTGTAKQHDLVETILASLDVSETPSGEPLARGRKGTYLEVYQVKSADAGEVTKTLSAMNIPGVQVVNEDRRTGRIHIMATERQHQEVAALVRQLDGSGSVGSVAVIPLAQMDPLSAATTLRALFYADGDDAPTIETDLYGRRLIVRGSIEHITQIKQVLADLGEDGSGIRQRGEGGTVRRFSLQGRDPEQFLKILKQNWEAQETSTLKILVPEEPGPVKSRQTSDGELPLIPRDVAPAGGRSDRGERRPARPAVPGGPPLSQRDDQPSSVLAEADWGTWQQPSARLTQDPESRDSVAASHIPVRTMLLQDDGGQDGAGDARTEERQDEQPRNEQPQDEQAAADSDRALELILLGDEVILSSTDEAELDRLEDLMDVLQQTLPFKQEYTQFFLKSADALEASDMLSQFFPSSSVATTSSSTGGSMLGSLTGSFSSMGSSLMDATGLSGLAASSNSLKIIPDIRTNSLFMGGPPMMVNDAIALLKVLDSNDGPDSLSDMQARTIAVDHADVADVKNMLDQLFKTYLEAQGGNSRQQQQNPLAAMFGGGGRGGADDPASQVRMHLAVDQQNSLILVNSSQALYDEVEKVVQGLDRAARDANRLIRVIQLKNADATMIQQSLNSLLPRVTISSSSTNSPGSSSSSGTGGQSRPDSGGGGGGGDQEAFQRMIQERMRQRAAGGDGGGRGGGGRSPFGGAGGLQRGGFGGQRGGGGGR